MPTLDEMIAAIAAKNSPEFRRDLAKQRQGKIKVKVNDYDQRSQRDLALDKFSGLRANHIWLRFELWIYGRLHNTLAYSSFWNDPSSLSRFYIDSFDLTEVSLEEETHRAVIEVEARKAAIVINERKLLGLSIDGSGSGKPRERIVYGAKAEDQNQLPQSGMQKEDPKER